MNFSAQHRDEILARLASDTFDVLVVGGGITGAGIALDAAARGLRVALVDMQDFAGGTSGRSTKLVHGGLRYLKQFEIGLVREVGRERKIIHELAPHLAQPEPMLLPLMKGDAMSPLLTRLAMQVYEYLAGVLPAERHRSLGAGAAKRQEPLLNTEGLRGAVLFYEYRTDDARLTLAVLRQAVARGAVALNHLKVSGFVYNNDQVSGAQMTDELRPGIKAEIRARHVVNAAGPWVDEVDALDNQPRPRLRLTKGVHLVFAQDVFQVQQAVYFQAFDGRMLFVIPRDGHTYLGTTDTFFEGHLAEPGITLVDRDYLLNCANRYFKLRLQPAHILSGWAGVRPLIAKPGKKPGEISRKDELFISPSQLITIAGGKLTGYRKMAQRVVDVIADRYRRTSAPALPPCTTDRIALSNLPPGCSFSQFIELMQNEAQGLGLAPVQVRKLVDRYGGDTAKVLFILRQISTGQLPGSAQGLPALLYAELRYCVEHEMCCTAADFFVRRSSMVYFDTSAVERWHQAVQAELTSLLPGVNDVDGGLSHILTRLRDLRVTPPAAGFADRVE